MIEVAPEWARIAHDEAMRGVREIEGVDHEERILEYHAATDLGAQADEVPWCSSFINWCMKQAGIARTRSPWARSWLTWGRVLKVPALGCVVILKTSAPDQPGPDVYSAPGHVGLYVGRGSAREILVLGGNQADEVNIHPYPLDRLLGYRWPG